MSRIPEAELARLKAEVSVQRLVEGCGVVVLRRQGNDLVEACARSMTTARHRWS